jgi:hypothetical protein
MYFVLALKHVSRLNKLRSLCIGDNSEFHDDSFTEIIEKCPLLENLNITLCTSITDKSAPAIAKHSVALKELTAEFCPNFATDATLEALSKGNNKLLERIVMGNGVISDNGVKFLIDAPFAPLLLGLDFRRNPDISTGGYDTISNSFPKIQEIDGILKSTLPESDVGAFFINKRSMTGEG